MVFEKANSTRDPKMKSVQTMNQISVDLMYETLGKELPMLRLRVMKVSMVLVPVDKMAVVTLSYFHKLHEIFVTLKGPTYWEQLLKGLISNKNFVGNLLNVSSEINTKFM
jgi:hypothetical protein